MFEGIEWRTGKSPSTFNKKLSAFEKTLIPRLKTVAEAITEIGVRLAKKAAPVDTGELRDKINGAVSTMVGIVTMKIEARAKHSPFQEFGTIYQQAQPFLRPTLQKLESIIIARTAKAYNKALKSTF